MGRRAVPEPGHYTLAKATSGAETQETIRESGNIIWVLGITWTGERWLCGWTSTVGRDAPRPARRMEALMQVVSEIHKQWGIECKPKDFILAVL